VSPLSLYILGPVRNISNLTSHFVASYQQHSALIQIQASELLDEIKKAVSIFFCFFAVLQLA